MKTTFLYLIISGYKYFRSIFHILMEILQKINQDRKRLIIIIGLPGSGKTILTEKIGNNGYIIFDEFITGFFDGKLIKSINSKRKNNICINDPRLCLFRVFQHYISLIEQHIDRSEIQLVLFENNLEECLSNISNRYLEKPIYKKGIESVANRFHCEYHLNNYQDWDHLIIPVWKPIEQ